MKLKFQLLLVLLFAISCQSTSKSTTQDASKKDEAAKTQESPKRPKSNDLTPRGVDVAIAPETVAFGSCANQDKPQPIWDVIAKDEPELFIFSGDNVYASAPETKPIGAQYKKLNLIPEFRRFREHIPILGDMG